MSGNETKGKEKKERKIKGQTRTKRNDAVTIMERTIEITEQVERMREKNIYSKRKTRERETNRTK